jgi:hypothetical protein
MYEVRTRLKGELRLKRFEHQREIHAETVLAQFEGEHMSSQSPGRGYFLVAFFELLIAFQQLADILRRDRPGVRHLDDHTVLAQHLAEFFGLFQEFAEIILERVVEFDADIGARAEDPPYLRHNFVAGAEFVSDVSFGIVYKKVIHYSGIACEVGYEGAYRLYLVRIGRVRGIKRFCRTRKTV